MKSARLFAMARRVEDLLVWQLGNELRQEVYALTAMPPALNDFKFCNQIRDAASSVTRNLAEGFGRYRHREMAQFSSIARASIFEVEDLRKDGIARKYWTEEQTTRVRDLCARATAAATQWIRYLRSSHAPGD